MQIDRPKEDVTLTAFMAGLRKGDDLCKDPPKTLSELMYEAQKHMNTKDAIESRDDPPPKRRKDVDDCKHEPTKQKVPKFSKTPKRKRATVPSVKFSSFTSLNTPIYQLLTPEKILTFFFLILTPIWRVFFILRREMCVMCVCVCASEHKFGVATNHGKFKV